MRILIRAGHLLDPLAGIDGRRDILVEEGKIQKVAEHIEAEKADWVMEAEGKYVMPGFIDLHVHFREPGFEYKETVRTGAKAAARGGYTTVCPMPNTKPVMDTKEAVEALLQKAEDEAVIHIVPVGAVTKGQLGEELADIAGMKKAGAGAISEDGKSVMDAALYREGMRQAKEAGIPVFAHCEDKNLAGNGVMNQGRKSKELGMAGISNAVEDVIVARDILLAKETGASLHLCHCSTADSVVLAELAKKQGLPVTAEVCPHHFSLCDEDILSDDGNYKMNPPLRSREDVEALKKGLQRGIMDVISTDHAPHSEKEKNQSIAKAPFGIVGLETAFALTVTELVKKGYLTPLQMVEKMSANPAKILGIPKGTLAEGNAADLVIADMDETYRIDKSRFASKGRNTPFDGKEVQGRVLLTMADGKVVYDYREEK